MAKVVHTKRITRAKVDDSADFVGFQLTFEVGGEFISAESAQDYANKLMDTADFSALCSLIDADLFCFIRDNKTDLVVLRNVNGSEDWDIPVVSATHVKEAGHIELGKMFAWNNALYVADKHLEDFYLEVREIAYINDHGVAKLRSTPITHRFNGYCDVVPIDRILIEA